MQRAADGRAIARCLGLCNTKPFSHKRKGLVEEEPSINASILKINVFNLPTQTMHYRSRGW